MAITSWWDQVFGAGKKATETRDNKLTAFLSGEWVDMVSSNVRKARYDRGTGELQVGYDDAGWAYTMREYRAVDFFTTGSKGNWIWSNVRVRGPGGDGKHRVPARRLW